ncbi:MAG: hypothetical protein OXG30_14625 [bacterium]|nr:hypothetical protein [bacterium]
MSIKVTALPAALGATVEGLDADHGRIHRVTIYDPSGAGPVVTAPAA